MLRPAPNAIDRAHVSTPPIDSRWPRPDILVIEFLDGDLDEWETMRRIREWSESMGPVGLPRD